SPDAIPAGDARSLLAPPPEERARWRASLAKENFGLVKADVMAGNVGYIRFDYFAPLEFAADTYNGAMAVVANTDALIVDLRTCSGSMSPDTHPTLEGYFFKEPVHLVDIYWRNTGETRQFWSA